MKRIILYRYHDNLDYCLDRLSFIQELNPEVPVYGLYGGEESEFEKFRDALSPFFSHNYCIRNKSSYWKWKNSDLAYRLWYQDYGKTIDFDSVVVLEWDLLLLDPIEKLYSHVQPEQIGMTGLIRLSKIEKKWFWTRDPQQRKAWEKLLNHVKEIHGYDNLPYASLCPGVIMPKELLERMSKIEIPEFAHDELRLPLYAQILGFELVDLGFTKKWFSPAEWKYFNCNDRKVSVDTIERELRKSKGRRVFHPFADLINLSFPEYHGTKSSIQQ